MKKIIDENGRLFGKISVIDIFVILIVLIAGVALYVKYGVLDVTHGGTETAPVMYQLTVRSVREYTIDSIKPGDKLFDKNGGGGNTVGTVRDIKVSDAELPAELVDGRLVMGGYEDHYDLVITVEADAAVSQGRYLVSRTYELNDNSIRTFYTKYSAFEAVITEIG